MSAPLANDAGQRPRKVDIDELSEAEREALALGPVEPAPQGDDGIPPGAPPPDDAYPPDDAETEGSPPAPKYIPTFTMGDDGRPVVTISPDGCRVNEAGRKVLLSLRDGKDPAVYRTATSPPALVAVEEVGNELRIGEPWTPNKLLSVLIDAARWQTVKVTDDGAALSFKQTPQPPAYVVKSLSADPGKVFPVLRGVVFGPHMDPKGYPVTAPGYNPNTGLYMAASVRPKVTGWTPSSVRALWDDWLCDFPFEGEKDYAHALALYLLPFVRAMVNGPTPLHMVEASTEGSGKSKLLATLLLPGRGKLPHLETFPEEPEEQRKALLSKLREGADVVAYDNATGEVGGAAIEAVLTSTVYSGRPLGVTQIIHVENRAIWALTANNATLSRDMVRRTVRIRLDPRCQDPAGRSGFRHPDIDSMTGWTMKHRSELAGAALWAAQEWIRRGRPEPKDVPVDSSFPEWRRVLGGLLEVVGVPGLLNDRKDRAAMKAALSPVEAEWRELMALWAAQHPPRNHIPGAGYTVTEPIRAAALVELAADHHLLYGLRKGDKSSAAASFGLALKKQEERVYPLTAPQVASAKADLGLDGFSPSPEPGEWRVEKSGISHKSGMYVLSHSSRWPAVRRGAS